MNNVTLAIAIWGAIIGTLTFTWNLLKWWQGRPHISTSIEALHSLWSEGQFRGIRLTLRNRGGKKTTIERVFLYRKAGWSEFGLSSLAFRFHGSPAWQFDVAVSNPKTVKLPVVLDENEVWEGFIPLEAGEPDDEEEVRQLHVNRELATHLGHGTLRYSVQCAHTNRRIRGLVGKEAVLLRE